MAESPTGLGLNDDLAGLAEVLEKFLEDFAFCLERLLGGLDLKEGASETTVKSTAGSGTEDSVMGFLPE